MSSNESNLKLHTSNLDQVHEKIKNMKVFHAPAEDDILWENNFYATAAYFCTIFTKITDGW